MEKGEYNCHPKGSRIKDESKGMWKKIQSTTLCENNDKLKFAGHIINVFLPVCSSICTQVQYVLMLTIQFLTPHSQIVPELFWKLFCMKSSTNNSTKRLNLK